MSKLIKMPTEEGSIIVEVESPGDELVKVSRSGERIIEETGEAFEKVESAIVETGSRLSRALKKFAETEPTLESASLEFGLQFTGEGNIFLVKTAVTGTIKVTLSLGLKKQ
ncbi:hypothetical protein GF407_16540 [candidate division KSB1 bacterium]|nr:hypothetical protein [candidate division KSB1 bacterium]